VLQDFDDAYKKGLPTKKVDEEAEKKLIEQGAETK
jgi:hypothetical protein